MCSSDLGIVWGIGTDKLITNKWNYGITFTGFFVNEKTIQYITKYMTKIDEKHKDFIGKVLCSKGIGAGYIKRDDAKKHTYKITDNNEIATKAIRLCLERIRKQTSKSIKHWFITELGHEKTERLHLHGIVWGIGTDKLITDKWNYGITFTGFFVNEKTINYITKYMLKVDVVMVVS